MHMSATTTAPSLILGSHDLARHAPSGKAEERDYWVDPGDYFALVNTIDAHAAKGGFNLQLTSDDGFASDYEVYFPFLLETGRSATFFVPSSFVGQPNRLTLAQLREMHAQGMSIGCHGVAHLNWEHTRGAELVAEITDAKHALEDMLGAPVNRAAPPFGAYDATVVRVCEEAGFTEVYSTRGGYSFPSGLLRPRVTVTRNTQRQACLITLASRGPRLGDRFKCVARAVKDMVA